MDVKEIIKSAQDSIAVHRAFGEPIQQGEATVIPVAWIAGGGGGGVGEGQGQEARTSQGFGVGGGYGMVAIPVGAFVINRGQVQWKPAVDVNLLIRGALALAAAALGALGWKRIRRQQRPQLLPGLRLLAAGARH